MNWRWLRAFPKFALVVILIVGSSAAFYSWWVVHSIKKAFNEQRPVPAEDIGPKVAKIEAKRGRLLLVDNDLYDLDSGAVIFKTWLKQGMPQKLFYDGNAKKFLAEYERGFVRYDTRGAVEAELVQKFKPAISDDYKWLVYSKDKDIWRADFDWKDFKLVNERKVTAIEQFNDLNFADNVVLGTEKTLIVRNVNKILRVDLGTGDVKPLQISLAEFAKRRSPDSKSVVGIQTGQFYCYDADTDDAKAITIGRGAINDYQWLDNDRCLAIAAMKTVVLYDRPNNTLTELAALPVSCQRIGEPSPDGRFAFCVGRGNGVLVDTTKKTAVPVTGGAGVCWISNDTFAFSREVADSELRGTWLQTVGDGERRVSNDPYLVAKSGPMLMVLKGAGLVVFATPDGLSTMKPDGTDVREAVKLARVPDRALGIEEWEN
ncbi:MAG: hypothetical protein QOE70_197 [Chthoniobacter sp.]|jgi:hypothetical protein|nr:hypothetical protein [Chthoniobacter sp.]